MNNYLRVALFGFMFGLLFGPTIYRYFTDPNMFSDEPSQCLGAFTPDAQDMLSLSYWLEPQATPECFPSEPK